jgi:hypothetical protein
MTINEQEKHGLLGRKDLARLENYSKCNHSFSGSCFSIFFLVVVVDLSVGADESSNINSEGYVE